MKKPTPQTTSTVDPVFRLQLVYADGTSLLFDGGSAFERDLIRVCREAIMARGVGVLKTEKHVAQAITEGMTAAIMDLKRASLLVL